MCNVCCKEFQGWCRAFTASEVILTILQAILLTLFVAFLTFLILHFIACSENENETSTTQSPSLPKTSDAEGGFTVKTWSPRGIHLATENETTTHRVPPDVACTWTPSEKTKLATQYFENDVIFTRPIVSSPNYDEFQNTLSDNDVFSSDDFDGKPADTEKSFILALVKIRPPDDITFGCILTIISEFWTLTAASCIESIEEVDTLDSFIMMENFGELKYGRTHEVSDVLIHPLYRGTNKTYDLAALKSEDTLTRKALLKLPSVLDYLLLTIGEQLTIIGFGKFRSLDRDAFARGARTVQVHVLPNTQCATRGDAWSARHLLGGVRATRGRCGVVSVCAGPLYARGTSCNYCAGSPLLQGRVLLGLMSDPGPCGAPCEPALYVNLVASQNWLNFILDNN